MSKPVVGHLAGAGPCVMLSRPLRTRMGVLRYLNPFCWKNSCVAKARVERTRCTAARVLVRARRWPTVRRKSR